MATIGYEIMFILDQNAYAKNPVGAGENIEKMIKDVGGELLASRLWNEQKLAYPIKGRYKGSYWLTYCRLESTRVVEFNRACQLNDSILRHLIVKIDERLIGPLVAAAEGKVLSEGGAEAVANNDDIDDDQEDGAEDDASKAAVTAKG